MDHPSLMNDPPANYLLSNPEKEVDRLPVADSRLPFPTDYPPVLQLRFEQKPVHSTTDHIL